MPTPARFRDNGNAFLDRLPGPDYDLLAPSLRPVEMTLKERIQEVDAPMSRVLFPITSVVSLLTVMQEEDPIEAATVGREGLIGLGVGLGDDLSPHRAICQVAGRALALPAEAFRRALEQRPALSLLFRRYVAFALRCAAQAIACNVLHPVEARASRWLLQSQDQVGGDTIPLTHDFLAFMLGVRRQTITLVLGSLQASGLIAVRRGAIRVVDRPRLERAACECYAAMRRAHDRVTT